MYFKKGDMVELNVSTYHTFGLPKGSIGIIIKPRWEGGEILDHHNPPYTIYDVQFINPVTRANRPIALPQNHLDLLQRATQ